MKIFHRARNQEIAVKLLVQVRADRVSRATTLLNEMHHAGRINDKDFLTLADAIDHEIDAILNALRNED